MGHPLRPNYTLSPDKIMSIHADLVAAKALIDTPEKFKAIGLSWSAAIYQVTSTWSDFAAAESVVSAQRVRGTGHPSIMDRFDRAIMETTP